MENEGLLRHINIYPACSEGLCYKLYNVHNYLLERLIYKKIINSTFVIVFCNLHLI